MEALDFHIEVGPGHESDYQVTARAPEGGEVSASVRLPLSPTQLSAQVSRIHDAVIASSATRRSSVPTFERPVQEFGGMLFNTMLADNVRGLLMASRQRAAQEGRPLRLVLRIHAAELACLPWEFLFDGGDEDYVCLNTPLIRYPSVLQPQRPLQVDPPLRILGMVARPGDQQTLAVEDEKIRLRDALADLERDGRVELSWVPGQTWRELQEAMRPGRGPWHVFHFIGHGGFDAVAEEGTLALADDGGRTYPLRAKGLARLLCKHPSLRLVLLNACDSGRASALDPFSSVAGSLMRGGIPAVLAMQFEITDLAAIEFSHSFYGAVAAQLPVDVAVTEARQAIQLALPGTLEWGTPVLYLRSRTGYIFDLADAPPISGHLKRQEEQRPSSPAAADTEGVDQLEDLYGEALDAFYAERWDEAIALLRAILARARDYKSAMVKLAEARHQQQLRTLYEKACAAADTGAWSEAVEQLESLLTAAPDYRDGQARLARARRERTVAELRDELQSLRRAKKWDGVLAVAERIRALVPNAPDADELAFSAREQLASTTRANALADSYREAVRHVEAGAWDQALAALLSIEAIDAAYQDTAELMARVRGELARRNAFAALASDLRDLLARRRAETLATDRPRVKESVEAVRPEDSVGDADGLYRQGRDLEERGELTRAEWCYRRAAEDGHPDAMADLGRLLERLGELDEAEQWYQRAADASYPHKTNVTSVRTEQPERWWPEGWSEVPDG
jgi:hypothetical protein